MSENPWAVVEEDLLTRSPDQFESVDGTISRNRLEFVQHFDRHKMEPIDLQEENGPFVENCK